MLISQIYLAMIPLKKDQDKLVLMVLVMILIMRNSKLCYLISKKMICTFLIWKNKKYRKHSLQSNNLLVISKILRTLLILTGNFFLKDIGIRKVILTILILFLCHLLGHIGHQVIIIFFFFTYFYFCSQKKSTRDFMGFRKLEWFLLKERIKNKSLIQLINSRFKLILSILNRSDMTFQLIRKQIIFPYELFLITLNLKGLLCGCYSKNKE